jgi:hypothetical protein
MCTIGEETAQHLSEVFGVDIVTFLVLLFALLLYTRVDVLQNPESTAD